MVYNTGKTGGESTIDNAAGNTQIRQEYYNKKAIIEVKDEMILAQMSDSMTQPKNMGKEVVRHRYIPLLSDENAGGAGLGLDSSGIAYANGNLYGSSRGMGVITGKLPNLGEDSKEVNKVSFSRKEVRGNIVPRGFYFTWTKQEVQFDSDPKWKMHVTEQAVRGAAQINEDVLAIELINGAGINAFAGDATTLATIDATSVPTLKDLYAIDTELDNNDCPKDTKIITGSKLTDTKTVEAARYLFISPEQKMDYMSIEALDSTPTNPKMAFIPVKQYADAAKDGKYIKAIHGEIGAVGPFRIVVNKKMVKYSDAAGAAVGAAWASNATNDLFRNDGTKFEVYPSLIVGSGCFTHIGFEYGAGTQGKFDVKTKTPEQLQTLQNPYANEGMTVVQFWNGVLISRPDHLAVYNTNSKF